MKCPMVSITAEPQDCTEDKCYFWDIEKGKCKWIETQWKKITITFHDLKTVSILDDKDMFLKDNWK